MAKLKKPGTIEPAKPAAPATATVPAKVETAPKAAGGGAAPREPAPAKVETAPPPPPPAPEPEAPALTPQQYSDIAVGIAPKSASAPSPAPSYGDEAQIAADRERRAKAMRAMAEKRGRSLPSLPEILAASNVITGTPGPGFVLTTSPAARAAPSVGRRAAEYLVKEAQKAGMVDENTIEQYRKKLADALPDWDIVGKPEGVLAVNPTGQRELVVRPEVGAPNLGESLAEYQTTARQQEDALRLAQAAYDASDADLRAAAANPMTPDRDFRVFERDMRAKLQRVADLRQSMRGMGYTEEEIKAIQ